jgi:cytochrome P450
MQTARAELMEVINANASGISSDMPLNPAGKESVFRAILDNPSLPPSEKSVQRLEQEGALLVLAGTESPAKSLNIIICHLLSNPEILSKLRSELNAVPKTASWAELEQLPYLSAVLEEGNRLSFGVTARTARIAHETLTYNPSRLAVPQPSARKSYTIPPGTPMSTTSLSAHTAETVFPDPFKFKPERWLGSEGRLLRRYKMAFGKGGRRCIGIELARAELYLATVALVRSFDMTLYETDEMDVAFVHDYQVSMPDFGSKGVRIMAKEL